MYNYKIKTIFKNNMIAHFYTRKKTVYYMINLLHIRPVTDRNVATLQTGILA